MYGYLNTWYKLIKNNKYYKLYEFFEGDDLRHATEVEKTDTIRGDILEEILKKYNVPFNGEAKIYDTVLANRLKLAMKILNSLGKEDILKSILLEVIVSLPDEEVIYWAWKVSTNKNGVKAFRILYNII